MLTDVSTQNLTDIQKIPRFSPLYLLPFGGGQFAQNRPIAGSTYLTIQSGLLAWCAIERYRFSEANKNNDIVKGENIRQRANLALSILVVAIATNIVEAVVVGKMIAE